MKKILVIFGNIQFTDESYDPKTTVATVLEVEQALMLDETHAETIAEAVTSEADSASAGYMDTYLIPSKFKGKIVWLS